MGITNTIWKSVSVGFILKLTAEAISGSTGLPRSVAEQRGWKQAEAKVESESLTKMCCTSSSKRVSEAQAPLSSN